MKYQAKPSHFLPEVYGRRAETTEIGGDFVDHLITP
jgi:hypothetical protein